MVKGLIGRYLKSSSLCIILSRWGGASKIYPSAVSSLTTSLWPLVFILGTSGTVKHDGRSFCSAWKTIGQKGHWAKRSLRSCISTSTVILATITVFVLRHHPSWFLLVQNTLADFVRRRHQSSPCVFLHRRQRQALSPRQAYQASAMVFWWTSYLQAIRNVMKESNAMMVSWEQRDVIQCAAIVQPAYVKSRRRSYATS